MANDVADNRGAKKAAAADRAARSSALRQQQERKDRRRRALVIGSVAVVLTLMIGSVVLVVSRERADQAASEAAAKAPIEGVETFDNLARDHVESPVTYEQNPPVGGAHTPVWTNCGVYDSPAQLSPSVHSLEHGAVWITYQPDLPEADVQKLADLAQGQSYVLVSPFDRLPSKVVASAWGLQLKVDSADDPRLQRFITKYQQGPQTPEPGAACYGGVGAA